MVLPKLGNLYPNLLYYPHLIRHRLGELNKSAAIEVWQSLNEGFYR